MNGKKLYRSESNRMLCGVCAGIAEYFDLDPTLIRLAWALVCFLGGYPGVYRRRDHHSVREHAQ